MAYRRKSYTYSGGDAIFPIPFDYIDEKNIFVFINEEKTTDFIIENHQVKLTKIPEALPATVLIVSKTNIDTSIVEWQDAAALEEENLMLANDQLLYAIQELYDNNDQFQSDTETTIANNQAELEEIIANNKAELENAQNEFEEEVNTKIQEVSEAAEKINELETAVEEAKDAAENAEAKAEEATTQANLAQQSAQEAEKAASEIEALGDSFANKNLTNLTEEGEKHF